MNDLRDRWSRSPSLVREELRTFCQLVDMAVDEVMPLGEATSAPTVAADVRQFCLSGRELCEQMTRLGSYFDEQATSLLRDFKRLKP